jgi:outer membrane receptor protein involved in Fe transport
MDIMRYLLFLCIGLAGVNGAESVPADTAETMLAVLPVQSQTAESDDDSSGDGIGEKSATAGTENTSASRVVVERSFSEKLPDSDDMTVAYRLAGAIDTSGRLHIRGSAMNDTVTLFDGIDITDPLSGMPAGVLPADTIETVEILTGGMPAEYGRAMGGIVKAVSRTGGNEFHGIFRYKRIDSDYRADDTHAVDRTLPDYSYDCYNFMMSGPVIQDKLWFMVSYNFFTRDSVQRAFAYYGTDYYTEGGTVSVNTDRDYTSPVISLTFQPVSNHVFTARYSDSTTSYRHSVFGYNCTPETWNLLETGYRFSGFEWTWQKSRVLRFNILAGMMGSYIDDKPDGGSGEAPAFYDTYHRMYYNNSSVLTEDDRSRIQLALSADYFIEDLMGTHEWKTGLEYQKIRSEIYNRIPGGAMYAITQIPTGDPSDPDFYTGTDAFRTLLINLGTAELSGVYSAYYLQDDWSVTDTITLNLGLRFETMRYETDTGETEVPAWEWGQFKAEQYLNGGNDPFSQNPYDVISRTGSMRFNSLIAPRLGVNWDVFGTGGTVVKAFYGRYYNPFDLQLPQMFQPAGSDNMRTFNQEYVGPQWTDRNRDGIPDEDYFFDDDNWSGFNETYHENWNLIDPNLKPEYTDEISVGLEQEIFPDVHIGLIYSYRETNDIIEDVGLFADSAGNITWTWQGGINDDFTDLDPGKRFDPRDNGQDYERHLYWITNVPGNRRRYHGVEFLARARKAFCNLQAGYTYSKAEGSTAEAYESSTGVAQFSNVFDTYQTSLNLDGELPWSSRHRVNLAGNTFFTITDWYEISFGVYGHYISGYHYSKRTTPPYTYDPDNSSNEFDDPQTWTGRPPYRSFPFYFPEGRGTYELPSLLTVDISVQNTFLFGRFGSLILILDVLNATNNQDALDVDSVYNPSRPDRFGSEVQWRMPREYNLTLKYAF